MEDKPFFHSKMPTLLFILQRRFSTHSLVVISTEPKYWGGDWVVGPFEKGFGSKVSVHADVLFPLKSAWTGDSL